MSVNYYIVEINVFKEIQNLYLAMENAFTEVFRIHEPFCQLYKYYVGNHSLITYIYFAYKLERTFPHTYVIKCSSLSLHKRISKTYCLCIIDNTLTRMSSQYPYFS